jgi:MYXO-CTERM domain-containing protein
MRWLMLLLAAAGASALSAEIFLEYKDSVYLRDYETARYRVDLDYGSGSQMRINIIARGFDHPPRVRVRDSEKDLITNREDNGADGILDFYVTARQSRDRTFFIDVTHKYAGQAGSIDVTLQLDADPEIDADGVIAFDKYYFDYHRPEDRHDCAAGSGSGSAMMALGVMAVGAMWFRRRRARIQ